ncbi:unnamed protein product, partial [Phaeothamnion confervicola]
RERRGRRSPFQLACIRCGLPRERSSGGIGNTRLFQTKESTFFAQRNTQPSLLQLTTYSPVSSKIAFSSRKSRYGGCDATKKPNAGKGTGSSNRRRCSKREPLPAKAARGVSSAARLLAA